MLRPVVFDLETKPFFGRRTREQFEVACAVTYEPRLDRWLVFEDEWRGAGHRPLASLARLRWRGVVLIGHAIWDNDLPILWANLHRREAFAKKGEPKGPIPVVDTQRVIQRAGGGCVGLDKIGLANFGAARRESGREASLAWAKRNYAVTIHHCRADVDLTHRLFERLRNGVLKLPTGERIGIDPRLLVPEAWHPPSGGAGEKPRDLARA